MLWRANCAISVSTMIATRVRRGLLLKIPTAYDIENTISGMSLHHCWPEYFCMARFNLYVILDNTLSQIFEKHPRGGGLGTYVGATRPALAPPSIRCCCRGCRACRALSGVGTVGAVRTVGPSLTVHAHGCCREIYYLLSGAVGLLSVLSGVGAVGTVERLSGSCRVWVSECRARAQVHGDFRGGRPWPQPTGDRYLLWG